MRDNTMFLIVGIVLILAIVGGIIFGIQTSNNITTNRNDISTLKNQAIAATGSISTLTDQLTAANNQISALKTQESADISSLKTQVTSLTDQLTAANTKITNLTTQEGADVTALKTQVASANDQIAGLNTQLNNLKSLETSDITAVKASVATLQASLTALQTTVTTLSTQVANLQTTTTTASTTIFSAFPITNQTPGGVTPIYTFTPVQSGNIYVSGNSSSATGFIRRTNVSLSSITDYTAFGIGNPVTIPVQAGYTWTISFGNLETVTAVNATLTGIFTPTTSITTSSTVFTTFTFTQGPLAQNQIASYTPTATGNFYLTGSSTLATAQILIQDMTAGTAPVTYTFGFGPSLTVGGILNHNFNIYIKNADAAVSVTWTLSGVYY